MRIAVISLRRTPERWSAFLQRNQKALSDCELLRIDGVDGRELINSNITTRVIAPSAKEEWSAGAIGIGLSHMMCWRMCSASTSPLVVLEDDVILADKWRLQLEKILNPEAGMVLLGWNLDSVLRAELHKSQELLSLFEPAYPDEDSLLEIVNSNELRQRKRLRNAFGLPGYWIQPAMASQLIKRIDRLETHLLKLGRGFPTIKTLGIDGLLNLHYKEIGAEILMPPLALAINDQQTSLTRGRPGNFG